MAPWKLLLSWTLMLLVADASRLSWLTIINSLGTQQAINGDANWCNSLIGLNRRQKRLCRQHIDLMGPVRIGATLSIDECKLQFAQNRWNCSQVDQRTIFGAVLDKGTREAAFIYSLSSAGVAWAVTKACSNGDIKKCGCDKTLQGTNGFRWGGCSDHISFGVMFSTKFIDAREKPKRRSTVLSDKAMMNLHNNMAGRLTIEENMIQQCKCHGVSGSCAQKSCWRSMPPFHLIGDLIKKKYEKATLVEKRERRRGIVKLVPQKKSATVDRGSLVYLTASPDFCEANEDFQTPGTRGRYCTMSPEPGSEDGSCDELCCSRGQQMVPHSYKERCDCKFQWCCKVRCQQCTRNETRYRCN